MIRKFLTILVLTGLTVPASAQITCTVSKYGKSCGPELTASVQPTGNTHRVSLTVDKVDPSSVLIMLIGAAQLDLPLTLILPNAAADCRLLLSPVFLQQHQPRSNGSYTYSRALPSTATGIGHAQFLELRSNGTVLATNGASLDCK